MFPFFSLGGRFFHTNTTLIIFSVILSFIFLCLTFQGGESKEPIWKHLVFALTLSVTFMIGSRVYHVLFESPELLQTPELIFTRLDGMTFYGGLALSLPVWWFLCHNLYKKENRTKLMDLTGVVFGFLFGLIRLGCMASGCCWGRVCTLPWAVRYSDFKSAMPYLGLPVHPVQLYESFLNFLIAIFLYTLYRKKKKVGHLFFIFLGLHGSGRFLTEFFRGDKIRGEDILLGLSNAQIVSLLLLLGLGARYLYIKRKRSLI